MNLKSSLTILASAFLLTAYAPQVVADTGRTLSPVDYVNPYIGNISHLLVPTFPTIQLPNSLMRVYPERADFTGDRLNGLPVIVTNHRERSAFNFTPFQGDAKALRPVAPLSYDLEKITPYRYQVYLDEAQIHVDFAPSHQSAVYRLQFEQSEPTHLVFNSRKGALKVEGNTVQGFQYIDNKTKIYLYVELDKTPEKAGVLASSAVDYAKQSAEGENAAVVLSYAGGVGEIGVRYGISLIDEAQAKKNLAREIKDYSVATIAEAGRAIWNETLGKIYGKRMKEIAAAFSSLSQEQIAGIEHAEGDYVLVLPGGEVVLRKGDYEISSEDMPGWLVASEGKLTLALDITITEPLRLEGVARELVNRIQNLRKECNFEVTDKIRATISNRKEIADALDSFRDYVCGQTLCTEIVLADEIAGAAEVEWEDNSTLSIKIDRV